MSDYNSNEHWHLDKRVPISLIAAIAVQTSAFVWFMSSVDSRLNEQERRTAILEARSQERSLVIAQNTTSIAVINETLRNVEDALQRIEKKLDTHESAQ